MNVLIFAIEAGRWGPARLPEMLKKAGLSVAALCPAGNALAATDFLDRHFPLPATRSSYRLAKALAEAIRKWQPQLIIPADEQVVALLHALVRQGATSYLDETSLDLVARSLGRPEQFDKMLMKSATLELARQLCVRVPAGGRVTSAEDAIARASKVGYPVFIKNSFGWAGRGVRLCESPADIISVMTLPSSSVDKWKARARAILNRSWYPMTSAVDVQQAIDGSPAMYCAVAWQGSMLGGFAGLCLETVSETGPSTAVWIGAHASMAKVAETMIRGMGATGFIGFDFMLEKATGKDYLLECNPRPIQVGHLGARIGVDLAGLLAAAIAGRSPTIGPVVAPVGDLKALLFPHALRSKSRHVDALLDIPWNDAGLLRFAGYDQRLTANSTVSPSSQVRRCTLTERPAF